MAAPMHGKEEHISESLITIQFVLALWRVIICHQRDALPLLKPLRLRKRSGVWNSVFEFHTCFLLLEPKLNQHLRVLTPTFKPQESSLLHNRPTNIGLVVNLLICSALDLCVCVCVTCISLFFFNRVEVGIKGPRPNWRKEQLTSSLSNVHGPAAQEWKPCPHFHLKAKPTWTCCLETSLLF